MQGHGCQKCGKGKKCILRRSNTIEFVEKTKKIHGGAYDYSKVVHKFTVNSYYYMM
jgi:hypothetical protein